MVESWGDEMTRSRARMTGAVYLLYFLTAIFAVSVIGRVPVAFSDAANLLANALYVGLTLLLFRLFRGVVAEGSLMLWLLIVGVNVPRWSVHAGVATR
jgi:hypothetical protein